MSFWPWRKDRVEPECPPDTLDQAKEARQRAEERYREIRDLTPEVAHLSRSLRSIRKRNHLIDILEESIRARDHGKGEPSHG